MMISRSAVVTRKTCEMKRYWNYHATLDAAQQTPGLVPVTTTPKSQLPKLRGQIFHEAAAKLFAGDAWQTYVTEACRAQLAPEMAEEQAALIRRALLGWTVVRAEVLADYTVVSAEQEWQWQMAPDVHQSLRLDRVLRRTDDGTLAIFDFKTLKAPDKNWIERLQHSEQTHLYVQALRERSTEWVLGMIYDGIIIGSLDDNDLRQKSPFVRAYRKKDGSLSPKYLAGAPILSTVDWTDDAWLAWAQETGILPELYCTTGPLLPTHDSLLQTKTATVTAERRWAETLTQIETDEDRMRLIERNPEACLKYGWDYACPYHSLCWQGAYPDPEHFTAREDHHG